MKFVSEYLSLGMCWNFWWNLMYSYCITNAYHDPWDNSSGIFHKPTLIIMLQNIWKQKKKTHTYKQITILGANTFFLKFEYSMFIMKCMKWYHSTKITEKFNFKMECKPCWHRDRKFIISFCLHSNIQTLVALNFNDPKKMSFYYFFCFHFLFSNFIEKLQIN